MSYHLNPAISNLSLKGPYCKVASVADLVSATDGHRQIVKFHEDFDDDALIVLEETSYRYSI